jgi:ankyrin repeat protein
MTHFGRPKAFELMLDLGFDPMRPGHDGGSAFHHSCWVGADHLVELMLRRSKLNLELRDPTHNSTPLGWAVYGSRHCNYSKGDYVKTVRLLLDAGARIDGLSKDGSPLNLDQVDASDAVKAILRQHQGH